MLKPLKFQNLLQIEQTILLGGETVSYSQRVLKIAVGKTAISVSKDEMDQILETRITERASKIVHIFNSKLYGAD